MIPTEQVGENVNGEEAAGEEKVGTNSGSNSKGGSGPGTPVGSNNEGEGSGSPQSPDSPDVDESFRFKMLDDVHILDGIETNAHGHGYVSEVGMHARSHKDQTSHKQHGGSKTTGSKAKSSKKLLKEGHR